MFKPILRKCIYLQLLKKRNLNIRPAFDWQYLTNTENLEEIKSNILNRKGVGNIEKLQRLYNDGGTKLADLEKLAAAIPNKSHHSVSTDTEPRIVETIGCQREFTFKAKKFVELSTELKCLRTENTGHSTGHRTYYLIAGLASLQHAIINFTIDLLMSKGFKLVSVPDILNSEIIEACGFPTSSTRSQVYHVANSYTESSTSTYTSSPTISTSTTPSTYPSPSTTTSTTDTTKAVRFCLSGTGEMALAGLNLHKRFILEDLPSKLMTMSRCYRAETSSLEDHHGIYRVHQFNKVEMFALTEADKSFQMLEEFKQIEIELFKALGLHIRVLEMSSCELGASAAKKYDVECLLSASHVWAELSSASNCTDYQTRRLDVKLAADQGGDNSSSSRLQDQFVHSVNATACAVPRLIMAIAEQYQTESGEIEVPACLIPYMHGTTMIQKNNNTTIKWKRMTNTNRNKQKQKM